jgi:hypothetical protein
MSRTKSKITGINIIFPSRRFFTTPFACFIALSMSFVFLAPPGSSWSPCSIFDTTLKHSAYICSRAPLASSESAAGAVGATALFNMADEGMVLDTLKRVLELV